MARQNYRARTARSILPKTHSLFVAGPSLGTKLDTGGLPHVFTFGKK